MSGVEWVAAGVSLIGAGLAYVGARHGSRPERQAVMQSQRDEWGRRFSEAIELLTCESERSRTMGRALIDALLTSDLAQSDDRRIAQELLRVASIAGLSDRSRQELALPSAGRPVPESVDVVDVVADDDYSESADRGEDR